MLLRCGAVRCGAVQCSASLTVVNKMEQPSIAVRSNLKYTCRAQANSIQLTLGRRCFIIDALLRTSLLKHLYALVIFYPTDGRPVGGGHPHLTTTPQTTADHGCGPSLPSTALDGRRTNKGPPSLSLSYPRACAYCTLTYNNGPRYL